MSRTFPSPEAREKKKMRATIRAGAFGNIIEWYDFSLYGFFAVLFAKQFFSNLDPVAGLLASFAVYGGAFIFRPVGAIVFGHIADRYGRKASLLISVVLMSISTAAIGLLPTYESIGVLAPLLLFLCRAISAASAGGEQSNVYVMVLEHSPVESRARSGNPLILSIMAGVVSGIAFALILSVLLPGDAMTSWGWRIPFLVAIPLGLLTLYMRRKLENADMYIDAVETVKASGIKQEAPLIRAFRTAKKPMLILFGWASLTALVGYTLIGFMASNLVQFQGYEQQDAYLILVIAFLIAMPIVYCVNMLADRISRKAFALIVSIAPFVWAIPAFWLLGQGPVAATIALVVWISFMYPQNLAVGLLVVELFPTDIRASAAAIPFQFGFAIFGGTAPYIATALMSGVGPYAFAIYVMVIALVGIGVAIWGVPQARKMDVVSIEQQPDASEDVTVPQAVDIAARS
jgi:MHS family proline/betaine transporter-like MFS transporter